MRPIELAAALEKIVQDCGPLKAEHEARVDRMLRLLNEAGSLREPTVKYDRETAEVWLAPPNANSRWPKWKSDARERAFAVFNAWWQSAFESES